MSPWRRYASFYVALLCGLAALPLAIRFWPDLAVQWAAIVFFIIYLALEIVKFHSLTPGFLEKHAASTDEPAWIIVVVTFAAVLAAVGSLFVLVNKGGRPGSLELALSLAAVALGWFSIHTMAALHYAHLYWRPSRSVGMQKALAAEIYGGLDFPGDEEPGGYDFLYFSLVIGMTAQTSDVAVTKTGMRKLNMLHAVVSFFFNTVLVAAAINVVVSLAAGQPSAPTP